MAELLATIGRELYRRANGRLAERMTNPRPGDLVIEMTSFGPWDPDQIGRIIRIEKADPNDDLVERWVVAPLHDPEREQGWRNATFIAIPDTKVSRWLTEGAPGE
jgi:hypothetical protein